MSTFDSATNIFSYAGVAAYHLGLDSYTNVKTLDYQPKARGFFFFQNNFEFTLSKLG